jgi:hypothetical protein
MFSRNIMKYLAVAVGEKVTNQRRGTTLAPSDLSARVTNPQPPPSSKTAGCEPQNLRCQSGKVGYPLVMTNIAIENDHL